MSALQQPLLPSKDRSGSNPVVARGCSKVRSPNAEVWSRSASCQFRTSVGKRRNQEATAIDACSAPAAEPNGAEISDRSVQGWLRECILQSEKHLLRPNRTQPRTWTVGPIRPGQVGQSGSIK
jgi:hypothetical protein